MQRFRIRPLEALAFIGCLLVLGNAQYLAAKDKYFLSDNIHDSLGCKGRFEVRKPDYRDETFLFRLFVPSVARTPGFDEKLPLIVWMHGHGPDEFSKPNEGHLFYIHNCIFVNYVRPADANFFLLAVQCPAADRPWFGKQPGGHGIKKPIEPGEAVVQIIGRLCTEEPIDRDRVSIIGISSGGSAALEMAMRYPHLFSAIAPTASSGGDVSRLDRIKNVPVWAFYNAKDSQGLINELSKTTRALQGSGGICSLTEVPGELVGDHDAWHEAFSKHGLLKWLLAQNRTQSRWASHYKWLRHTHLNWDHLGPQTVLIVLLFACWTIRRMGRIRHRRAMCLELTLQEHHPWK